MINISKVIVRGEITKVFKKYRHIHFVGIGGIGMSGIAELLINLGYSVSGSDVKESDITRRLSKHGAKIYIGHRPEQIEGADVVVVSSAIPSTNPEVIAAKKTGKIPVIKRAEMLAELMRLKYAILVAGAHGKTTTTSMIATVLTRGGIDPTVVIGGKLNAWRSNVKLGQGEFLVAEADESDGTFLLLSPTIAVVTNIDAEHLDYYKDLGQIQDTFLEFINKIPFYGRAILCLEDENIQEILPRVKKPFVTYGFTNQAEFQARDVKSSGLTSSYRLFHRGKEVAEITLNLPGLHNVLNSLAAVAVATELEIRLEDIQAGFLDMTGVERRFQIKGERDGVLVMDDYGHHPTEIKAVLKTLAECYGEKRRVVVFQPHRYTRTKALFNEFTKAFYQTDVLIVTDIYPASEEPIPGVSAEKLAKSISEHGHGNVVYLPDLSEVLSHLSEIAREGDLVLTLGAGDVWKVGEKFLEMKGRKEAKPDE